jgi:hypothetical protein
MAHENHKSQKRSHAKTDPRRPQEVIHPFTHEEGKTLSAPKGMSNGPKTPGATVGVPKPTAGLGRHGPHLSGVRGGLPAFWQGNPDQSNVNDHADGSMNGVPPTPNFGS